MENEVKKLKVSEAEKVSGGEIVGPGSRWGTTLCKCEKCGKTYENFETSRGTANTPFAYQHALCPDCRREKFPEWYQERRYRRSKIKD